MAKDAVQDAPDISLGAFLEENYRLFAIMSVFGGVSALLLTVVGADLADTNLLVRRIVHIGIVASLLLFALVAYTINQRFFAMYVDRKLVFLHPDTWSKFVSGVFLLLFDVLVLCTGAIMAYYGDAFWTVTGVLLFLFAIVATYRLMYHTMLCLKTGFQNIGRDVGWGRIRDITIGLYIIVIFGVLFFLIETTGYMFDPVAYLQDHPLSLMVTVLIGCLIGVLAGSALIVDNLLDRKLEETREMS